MSDAGGNPAGLVILDRAGRPVAAPVRSAWADPDQSIRLAYARSAVLVASSACSEVGDFGPGRIQAFDETLEPIAIPIVVTEQAMEIETLVATPDGVLELLGGSPPATIAIRCDR